MAFGICACGGGGSAGTSDSQSEQAGTAPSVNLAYNSADTFNPYTAKTTLNKNLCSLLFDPLVTVNSQMLSENVLAANCELSGTNLIVTLKNASFTDGSPLTADDVVYSFNLAKNSSSRYSATLSVVTAAQVRDAKSVIFTLTKSDPYAASLLTFPIIKIGTDELKTEDNVYLTPVGTGRYTLNSEQNGLVSNKNWHGGKINIEKTSCCRIKVTTTGGKIMPDSARKQYGISPLSSLFCKSHRFCEPFTIHCTPKHL